ncbi:HNH endonuclease [Corynebacterium hindlerae]|uniref:HNH endonuclease n=1 Tax=Corynebacterium hindlerae TaxID=699041 RepID=A0A7G5FDP9_9CORY|nr:HNH endonuclease [Corynebacterium hindlerae]QMV84740.1 HNH endonuclease [Corynebacterium hindlerae]
MARWGGRRVQRLLALVLAEYGDTCHLCGQPGADTVDHIVPRSWGGDDSLDNVRPAHHACNCSRGAMPLDQWRERHPIAVNRAPPSRKWA